MIHLKDVGSESIRAGLKSYEKPVAGVINDDGLSTFTPDLKSGYTTML